MLDSLTRILPALEAIWASGGAVMPALALATVLLGYSAAVRATLLRPGPRGILAEARARAAVLRGQPQAARRLRAALVDLRQDLGRGATLLHTICLVAPLLGLLGTVGGMVETFDSLAEMQLFRQGGGVAAGVAQALLTTQVGLVIAVPGLLLERALRRRQQRLEAELEALEIGLGRGGGGRP